jgi:3-oxocholest-4-en-26-oyl-CoA dehydrogenase beta subunit
MQFELTEDQRAFADMAQSLFADFCSDDQLREHDVSGRPFMQALWEQCVAAGLHSIVVPESHGGLGLGMTELMTVLEQQGKALALVPLWEQQLVAATLAQFGTPDHAPTIEKMLAGELATVSLSGVSDSRGLPLHLSSSQGQWMLHGVAQAVPLGISAQHALLAATLNGKPHLVLADLGVRGVRRVGGLSQHHQEVADLHFDQVSLELGCVLESAALDWLLPRAIASTAALQTGVSEQQLARTVDYISERKQFDRVIGSFQLVAGQMADGYTAVEALRSALWQLVYRIDTGLGTGPQAHSVRILSNDTGHRVGHMAQHVHGGIGVDITYPIHRFLYWSRALGAALGGSEYHLSALGDWLAHNDNLGWKYDLPEDELH